MSCTTLFRITHAGLVVPATEFSNAWRGAMFVWTDFGLRYGIVAEGETHRILMDLDGTASKIWALGNDPTVPRHERIVLLSTFDRALCRAADFPELVQAFRRYHHERMEAGKPGSSLGEQADMIEVVITEHPDTLGCGWWQTSVSECSWYVHENRIEDEDDENEGESRPYDVNRDDHHFWIFDDVNSCAVGNAVETLS